MIKDYLMVLHYQRGMITFEGEQLCRHIYRVTFDVVEAKDEITFVRREVS